MFIEPSHLLNISECLKPCAAGVVLTSALCSKAVTSVTVSTVLHVPMRTIKYLHALSCCDKIDWWGACARAGLAQI